MKTIKLTSAAILAAATLGTFATLAHAEDANTNLPANLSSEGIITYKASEKPNKPVDPSDPNDPDPGNPIDPNDPEKPVKPGTPGPLSIDYISNFNFGEQEITSSDMIYTAAEQKFDNDKSGPNYVQVTDNRGTLGGWSLSVVQDNQFSAGGTGVGSVLDGAAIMLDNGHIVSASTSPADVFASKTILVPGVKSGIILGATAGNGTGTNLLAFGDKDASTHGTSVTLAVPGATTKLAKEYSTTLTWTLSDTPTESNTEF